MSKLKKLMIEKGEKMDLRYANRLMFYSPLYENWCVMKGYSKASFKTIYKGDIETALEYLLGSTQ